MKDERLTAVPSTRRGRRDFFYSFRRNTNFFQRGEGGAEYPGDVRLPRKEGHRNRGGADEDTISRAEAQKCLALGRLYERGTGQDVARTRDTQFFCQKERRLLVKQQKEEATM